MDSLQIKKKLRNIKSFIGVYPRDALPDVGKRPVALIANTDSKYEPGEHWIAIILLKDGRGEYFDSYGLPTLHGDFQRYMSNMCPNKWWSTLQTSNNQSQRAVDSFVFISYVGDVGAKQWKNL